MQERLIKLNKTTKITKPQIMRFLTEKKLETIDILEDMRDKSLYCGLSDEEKENLIAYKERLDFINEILKFVNKKGE